METFGEKISAEACSGKEIATEEDEDDDQYYDDSEIAYEQNFAWQIGGR